MSIKVNTEAVCSVASILSGKNAGISEDFQGLEKEIISMEKSWKGSAANQAMQHFYNVKNTYYDRRSIVVEEFISFMLTQVGQRYEITETKIHSAADAFK